MRRLAATCIGACLVASVGAFSPVANATAEPLGLSAGYRLHIDAGGHGYTRELMTLLENHTGYTDIDWIAWSRTGRHITLVFTNRLDHSYDATYVGTIVPDGISTRRQPGTISGPQGDAGVFYAVNMTT
jgi:hypothetical protein